MKDLIICVAPFPGEKQEEKFSGKMNVAHEVIDCYNAGASIAHLHVRDREGLQTTDTRLFQKDIEQIHSCCPIIIEGSTGGAPEHTLEQRCVSFTVPGVEMGSLNLGSVNLWDGVYSNKLADVLFYATELKKRGLTPFLDCFDLSHFHCLPRLEREELISPPYTFGFVFDIPNALPFQDRYLDYFLRELPEQSCWFLVRHHAGGASAFAKALELGGHIRVGYKDGPFLSDRSRARSNAALVEDIANAAEKSGRSVVNPDRAREILGIKKKHDLNQRRMHPMSELKMAVITGFLSRTKDRFHEHNEERNLVERFQLVADMEGIDGVELVHPYELAEVDAEELKTLLNRYSLKIVAINANIKAEPDFLNGGVSS